MKKGLLEFLQSASNSVAGNVAGPVDLLSLGLTKLGVNVGVPVGGTEWMKSKGLMADVPQGPARVLGETAGLLGPAMATQFAPQIARGLLRGGENLAAPQRLNSQAGAVMVDPSDYRGGHTAPMKSSGHAPLHDLTKAYPADIYSKQAAEYYGNYGGDSLLDRQAIALMQAAKSRPDMPVTMYRAVPFDKTVNKQIGELDKQIADFVSGGKVPKGSYLDGNAWHENALRMKEKLLALAEQQPQRLAINNGDWVTLSKEYAKEHGEGALSGKYKVISKKVPARKLFTDGNSIQEFGYDESGRASLGLLGLLGAGVGGGAYLASDK